MLDVHTEKFRKPVSRIVVMLIGYPMDDGKALSSAFRIVVFILVAICCFGCDRVSKFAARMELQGESPRTLFGNAVILEYQENQGAMLSIGAGLSEQVRFWLFTVGIAVMVIVLALFLFLRSHSLAEIGAGALAIGGGLGNLVDRLVYGGAVVDFVSIGVGPFRTAVFNIADISILAGVLLYFLSLTRRRFVNSSPPGV
jgi:signal peptidase II